MVELEAVSPTGGTAMEWICSANNDGGRCSTTGRVKGKRMIRPHTMALPLAVALLAACASERGGEEQAPPIVHKAARADASRGAQGERAANREPSCSGLQVQESASLEWTRGGKEPTATYRDLTGTEQLVTVTASVFERGTVTTSTVFSGVVAPLAEVSIDLPEVASRGRSNGLAFVRLTAESASGEATASSTQRAANFDERGQSRGLELKASLPEGIVLPELVQPTLDDFLGDRAKAILPAAAAEHAQAVVLHGGEVIPTRSSKRRDEEEG